MKDPADAFTLELPYLGICALPDWLQPALPRCPIEGGEFLDRLRELQQLERYATTEAFIVAYERMLGARDRLYDAWIGQELDHWPDDA